MTTEGRRVHFIGVGGAGMSAIAKVMLERGVAVSGSDLKRSRAVTVLEAMGARVHVGHDERLVDGLAPGRDSVVVSSAIPSTNVELSRARELGLRAMSRGEALAALLAGTRSIVVAGTHGKTTTTSMIVTVLRAAGLDPTYLVGGELNDAGTNARLGRGELMVAESDESDGSFLLLEPHIGVVTNVEAEHLDHWDSFAALRGAFESWVGRIDPSGAAVVPADDGALAAAARAAGRRVVAFGPGGAVVADDVVASGGGASFVLRTGNERVEVALRVPGLHNVANALAAAAACLQMGLGTGAVAAGLGDFRGVGRRFETRGSARGVTVIDDYAHHPTEVRTSLATARASGWRRVVAVFQPHRYSRTAALWAEFGGSFADADAVVVTDVYGAGEDPVPGVSGKLVTDAVCGCLPGRPVAYLPHREELLGYLERSARRGDALVTMGAGDITSVGAELLERLERS